MKHGKLFAVGVLAALPVVGWSYDSAFTLTFENASDTEGWADLANPINTEVFAGENVAVDNPPRSVAPEDADNYNGTNWLRLGSSAQQFGVGTYVYSGTAGGSGTESQDFVVEADVFIDPTANYRYMVALFGRWVPGSVVSPPEIFYSRGTPGQPDGFGWRHGVPQTYNGFPEAVVTEPQWVRMRAQFIGDQAQFSVDLDMDGTYDHVSAEQTMSSQLGAGRVGFQTVINDGTGSAIPVANQFGYFDNLTFTPVASVSEWSLY